MLLASHRLLVLKYKKYELFLQKTTTIDQLKAITSKYKYLFRSTVAFIVIIYSILKYFDLIYS